jgi:hypothetical protein
MNPDMRAVDPGRPGHAIKHLDSLVLGEGFESVGLRVINQGGLTHGPGPIILRCSPR